VPPIPLVLTALAIFLWVGPASPLEAASPPDAALAQGLEAFQRGAFEDAVSRWTEAAQAYERDGKPAGQVTALIQLSQAQSALGQYRQAIGSLETALGLADRLGDKARMATVLSALGNAYSVTGSPEAAEQRLRQGLALARQSGDASLTAATLNNLGNLLSGQGRHADALATYRESATLARQAKQPVPTARALANAAASLRQQGRPKEARGLLDEARLELRPAPASHDKAFALINVALGYRDLRPVMPEAADSLLREASQTLTEAGGIAEGLGDRRTASYAWGHLGGLYEEGRRHEEALRLTRRAVLAAQQVNAPESLYRWQWQAGRILKKLGSTDDAIGSYRRAVATLQSIRPELTFGYGPRPLSFRESTGQVYFELVDLLLQRAAAAGDRAQIGPYLGEARETVELLKAAELRDYFRDDCVDTALAKVVQLDVVSQTAVVVYPILLPDRTELLLSLPSGLKSIVVKVTADALTREVRQFRLKLEKRTTREYLPHAQRLYDWLIRPLEPDLAAANTLVFVPDGPLRTIPMAALHDGKQFLVSKYATAITPGLNLTDPRPVQREKAKVLAVGVTEAVQGFPPLPNVAAELAMLKTLFKDTTTLVDQSFLASTLEEKLKKEQFTIVHVASHGQFESDADKTFLLTFDDKVSIDRLDQFIGLFKFRDVPLELLTLSACETAAGDDRAALGLAGVAIKAGARSAVATLWQVHDEVAAVLVEQFYRQLQDPAVSRAAALQRAQLKVLENPRYEHPGFWSPFLMINSWL
jgi:CHAT domain-containing protein/Tfp pilus assembly protein PilF